MITAMKRAEWMALQIIIAARLHNSRVVTDDLVDVIMSRDADTEQGKANKATVRRLIRAQADSEGVRVIFTRDEQYWAIREQLHHMSTNEVRALRDEIAGGGVAAPGWDRQLVDAISARLSKRPAPRRLDTAKPVSIRLWRDPRPATPDPLREGLNSLPATAPTVTPQPARCVFGHSPAVRCPNPVTGTVYTQGGDLPACAFHGHTPDPLRGVPKTAALFSALAAHEVAALATPSTPRDLDDLARHLLALGKVAAPAYHLAIVEAHADVEEAREALHTAHSLQARHTAYRRVRAAVEQARTVILAVAPNAGRMHGTDMPATADAIRAAARAYNAVACAPEELSAIETGTPAVHVACQSDTGDGWLVTARITAVVDTPLGRCPAHPPIVVKFRKQDGRLDAAVNARRVLGDRFRVEVPVTITLDRRV